MREDSVRGERFMCVVGRRTPPPLGNPPSPAARAAMASMARYLTRAPKGVFVYSSHAAANRDRDEWTIEAILARAATDG